MLIEAANLGILTTLLPSGYPLPHPTWIDALSLRYTGQPYEAAIEFARVVFKILPSEQRSVRVRGPWDLVDVPHERRRDEGATVQGRLGDGLSGADDSEGARLPREAGVNLHPHTGHAGGVGVDQHDLGVAGHLYIVDGEAKRELPHRPSH